MNKAQAAKRLKISVRSLQRAVKDGRIKVKYQRGKSGKMEAVFDNEEIEHFREELKQVIEPAPAPPADTTALVPTRDASRQTQLVALVSQTVRETMQAAQTKAPTSVALENRLTLSIPEAALVSGIPADRLRSAVKSGSLKAIKGIGRGLGKIKRADLDAYIKQL